MSQDCSEKVTSAEVAVDNCLEEEVVAPGTSLILCATLKEHEVRTVTVRSEEWVWVDEVKCTTQKKGSLIPVALYCIER